MHWPSFEKEKQLVEHALYSEQGEIALRQHVLPLVKSLSGFYARRHAVGIGELVHVAYTHFDYAVLHYARRLHGRGSNRAAYNFSAYFVWYIQQSIETYLGVAKQPLTKIQPRIA